MHMRSTLSVFVVPAAIMLDRYTHQELVFELGVELCWVIGLFVLCRIAFVRGVRRYGAFGG